MRQTEEGNLKFKECLTGQDWNSVFDAVSSYDKALVYQGLINGAMNNCYPLIRGKKSTDDPWITE